MGWRLDDSNFFLLLVLLLPVGSVQQGPPDPLAVPSGRYDPAGPVTGRERLYTLFEKIWVAQRQVNGRFERHNCH